MPQSSVPFDAQTPCVFLTGSSRSGTELQRQILNRHPQVFIAGETHFFADLRKTCEGMPPAQAHQTALKTFADLRGSAYGMAGSEATLPLTQRLADLRAASRPEATPDEVFLAHCQLSARDAGRSDLALWGEKCPRHIFHTADILASFPQAKIIFMLRDPCAVATSYRDWTNHWYDGRKANPAIQQAILNESRRVRDMESLTLSTLMWRGAVKEAQRALAVHGPERLRIQSFEKLLQDPAREIAALCSFLGLEGAQAMLQVPRVNSSYGPQGGLGRLDAQAGSAWQSRMSAQEIWWVRRLSRSVAVPLGYPGGDNGPFPGFAAREMLRFARKAPLVLRKNRSRNPQILRRLLAAFR